MGINIAGINKDLLLYKLKEEEKGIPYSKTLSLKLHHTYDKITLLPDNERPLTDLKRFLYTGAMVGYKIAEQITQTHEIKLKKTNLAAILHCSELEIATNQQELMQRKKEHIPVRYYVGDLDCSTIEDSSLFKYIEMVWGSLDNAEYSTLYLPALKCVWGDVTFGVCRNIHSLPIETVIGNIDANEVHDISYLYHLTMISGNIYHQNKQYTWNEFCKEYPNLPQKEKVKK